MILTDAAATMAVGRALAAAVRPGDAITLTGGLGTGKTTLARGLLAGLGLVEEAPSPTFPIVVGYGPPELGLAVAHVDLYRLDPGASLNELGLDEARADGVLIVEWPERAAGAAILADALELALAMDGDARRLTASVPPAWSARWPFR